MPTDSVLRDNELFLRLFTIDQIPRFPRFGGDAYHSILRRLETFADEPLRAAVKAHDGVSQGMAKSFIASSFCFWPSAYVSALHDCRIGSNAQEFR